MASSMTSSVAEDDFMRVLDEMNRLCGGEEDEEQPQNDLATSPSPPSGGRSDPFEGIFAASSSGSSSSAPLIGDQLLSSTASNKINGVSRSRHCSANSAKSCMSFDSAIGDVYSVQTPTRTETSTSSAHSSHNGNFSDLDLFDFSTSSATSSPPTLATNTCSATASAGLQFDNLAASVCFESNHEIFDTCKDVDGLGGISLRLVGSEDLVSTSLNLAMNDLSPSPLPKTTSTEFCKLSNSNGDVAAVVTIPMPPLNAKRRHEGPAEFVAKKKRPTSTSTSPPIIMAQKQPPLMTPELIQQRHEVDRICLDLLKRFQHACCLHPKTQARVWMAKSGEDPLLITTRLLGDSLTRLKIFVQSLDPMNWLVWCDRDLLYSNNVCTLSVFKAAVSVNLEVVPTAYQLPYGEYLGEVEALHLILAHELYNELRALLSHIQSLCIREFPVMLLVMMMAFFSPHNMLKQPDKVVRVNEYYTQKLQVRVE